LGSEAMEFLRSAQESGFGGFPVNLYAGAEDAAQSGFEACGRGVLGQAVQSGIAKAVPQRFIPVESHDMGGELGRFGAACGKQVLIGRPAKLAGQKGGGDGGQAEGRGLVQLVRKAGGEAGRCDEDAVRCVESGRIGDGSAKRDAGDGAANG
jgi:hypothetical protein